MTVRHRPRKKKQKPDRVPKMRAWIRSLSPGALAEISSRSGVRLATFYDAAVFGFLRFDVAQKVAAETKGAVTAADLLCLPVAPRRARKANGRHVAARSERGASSRSEAA